MRSADRIVIIGYSFPPTDIRPLELIRNVLTERKGNISVDIVAPDAEDIGCRIGKEHLSKAKNVVIHSIKFEEYLSILYNDVPNMMKIAATKYDEVKEWLERIYAIGQAATELYRE
jgi:hypothetical protein